MTESLPDKGDKFPAFTLPVADGDPVDTGALGPAVVFFYPKDDTPGCTTEAKDFTALAPQFADAGVALLGVSKDSVEKHAKFTAKHNLAVPLASDPAENGLSDALGIWTEKKMYGRTFMGMVRTTYLIDADGLIAQVWRKVKVKGHAEAVLEAAKAL